MFIEIKILQLCMNILHSYLRTLLNHIIVTIYEYHTIHYSYIFQANNIHLLSRNSALEKTRTIKTIVNPPRETLGIYIYKNLNLQQIFNSNLHFFCFLEPWKLELVY